MDSYEYCIQFGTEIFGAHPFCNYHHLHLWDRGVVFPNGILCLTHLNVLDNHFEYYWQYTILLKYAHGSINIYLLALYGNASVVPPFVGVTIRMHKTN